MQRKQPDNRLKRRVPFSRSAEGSISVPVQTQRYRYGEKYMKNFEQRLERLEELGDTIKSPELSLEDALKVFEEGIRLAKGVEKELD